MTILWSIFLFLGVIVMGIFFMYVNDKKNHKNKRL